MGGGGGRAPGLPGPHGGGCPGPLRGAWRVRCHASGALPGGGRGAARNPFRSHGGTDRGPNGRGGPTGRTGARSLLP
ncbi:MAG: hypothetical protein EA421_12945 [Gemmatimonadales bacterium]|nr:MAG: hypothetical protein EA421_12945 [Gemmatimonadales bacterium]